MTFLIAALIALACVAFGVTSWAIERHQWNGGVCRASGLAWRRFDTDSSGARGYCDDADNVCWISWPLDRAAGVKEPGNAQVTGPAGPNRSSDGKHK